MSELIQFVWPTAIVVLYYMVVWIWWGRDPTPGTIVTLYDPPRGMSPALMRYCWKQRFDERVVWSGLTNLACRGLAVFETREDGTYIRPVWPPRRNPALPREEAALHEELATAHGRHGVRLAMTDELMRRMTMRMAAVVMQRSQGQWFVENRIPVLAGALLSAAALMIALDLSTFEQTALLILPAPIIAVSGFYLYFLIRRLVELVRVGGTNLTKTIVGRLATMLIFTLSCLAGIWFGSMFLYAAMGWKALAIVAELTAINLLFVHLMKAPTREGRKLLDEIEGFRHFLQAVERLPMNRADEPSTRRGLYEEYLPYALALEVEQQWCDQMAAVGSSSRQYDAVERGTMYHLGMWNGSPVDVAIAPLKNGR